MKWTPTSIQLVKVIKKEEKEEKGGCVASPLMVMP